MEDPLVAQLAALLQQVLTQRLPASCPVETMEGAAHKLVHEVARQALERLVTTRVEAAERPGPVCACGTPMLCLQRRRRALLCCFGLLLFPLRRFRCPNCGAWQAPGASAVSIPEKQRMTQTVREWALRCGLGFSYAPAAAFLSQLWPGVEVSAKTVERLVRSAARAAPEQESQESGLPFLHPRRCYVSLDGILVRGRAGKEWLEMQVAALWSACRELPRRTHPRRQVTDRSFLSGAEGWESLGWRLYEAFEARQGPASREREVVVLADGASGIRTLYELHFPGCRAILDPWHLHEKVKERARQVFSGKEAAFAAVGEVWAVLKRGGVAAARTLIEAWAEEKGGAGAAKERLLAYLERNQEQIPDYEALRGAGYQGGAGLTEKANDLVVAPRMKNGKMHWSRAGAHAVALLRARLLTNPNASLLPI